jgi:hypothetical protein
VICPRVKTLLVASSLSVPSAGGLIRQGRSADSHQGTTSQAEYFPVWFFHYLTLMLM